MSENVKRILLLSTAYLPAIGGSELALKNLTERLGEYEFDLITGHTVPGTPVKEQQGNLTIYRVGGFFACHGLIIPKIFLPFSIVRKARQLLRVRSYSLMHAYQASQAAGAGWLLKHLYPSLPFLLTIQEGKNLSEQPWIIRALRNMIFTNVNRATAISTYLQKYAQSVRADMPVDWIPNGVDFSVFVRRDASLIRRHLGIPDQHAVLVSISRLVEKNGIEFLIRALPKVHGINPSSLVLVGDGPLRKHLETVAMDAHVDHIVHWIPRCLPEEVPLYLSLADVFIRPSISEGFGTAFIEAMALEVPVVGTSVGGIKDFLVHERTGLICKTKNPDDIAQQIIRILRDDHLRAHIIEQSKMMVHERYSWDHSAEQMRSVYQQFA